MSESRIWRYSLPITDEVGVLMPEGAQVLSVAPSRTGQRDVDLWAVVDPGNDTTMGRELRKFRIVGTGNPVPSDVGRFVGTVAVLGGRGIFHVFEAHR